jgi:protein SCO1
MKKGVGCLFSISVILASVSVGASAQQAPRPGPSASELPPILREVGFDQNIDKQIPLDVTFKDENGQGVQVGKYFGARPVVLNFVYYDCPMICLQTLSSLASTLKVLSQEPGKDFEIVTVSFDPRETPALALNKKREFVERSGKPHTAGGWHFLTGAEPDIDRLTQAAGFRYVWDESAKQFAHPTGIIVLTPGGRIARYLFGIDYGPRDLRLAILDASANKVGSPIERALLYCYHYDLATGRYSLAIMRVVRVAGVVTVFSIGTLIFVLSKRPSTRPAGTRSGQAT